MKLEVTEYSVRLLDKESGLAWVDIGTFTDTQAILGKSSIAFSCNDHSVMPMVFFYRIGLEREDVEAMLLENGWVFESEYDTDSGDKNLKFIKTDKK